MIQLDGSRGEGGGQILRTSVAAAALTGQAFRIEKIRAGREKPGLKRQHLTAIEAAATICGAHLEGAEVGASEISFEPGEIRAGDYRFEIGTAGSTTLVAQTVLPILLAASGPSRVTITGGTHCTHAPTYEHFAETFLPQLRAMGAKVESRLVRHGFYPAGGGEIELSIEPWTDARPFHLDARDAFSSGSVSAVVANLARAIADDEARIVAEKLHDLALRADVAAVDSPGPGNAVWATMRFGGLVETFSEIGQYERSRKAVAHSVADVVRLYLKSGAPVDLHLADQLLLPLAWAAHRHGLAASFVFERVTPHFETNVGTLAAFFPDVPIAFEPLAPDTRAARCRVGGG